MEGYIYVLINPAMEGLVKIGMTTRNPENRVKELSSATGIPNKFILIYQQRVDDCASCEKAIHNLLEAKGYRVSNQREFFNITTTAAIDVVSRACRDFSNFISEEESTSQSTIENNVGAAEEVFYLACEELNNGNAGKALELFEKSAESGFVPGYWRAVELLKTGDLPEVRPNLMRAYELAKKGKELGVLGNHVQVVDCLIEMGHAEKAVTEIQNIYTLGKSGKPGYDDLSNSIYHLILSLQYCDAYTQNPIPIEFSWTAEDLHFIEAMYDEARTGSDPAGDIQWLNMRILTN
jgi:hypothetical protein